MYSISRKINKPENKVTSDGVTAGRKLNYEGARQQKNSGCKSQKSYGISTCLYSQAIPYKPCSMMDLAGDLPGIVTD